MCAREIERGEERERERGEEREREEHILYFYKQDFCVTKTLVLIFNNKGGRWWKVVKCAGSLLGSALYRSRLLQITH